MNALFKNPGDALDQAHRWIDESECILVGAGAGLSAAAGIDYTDQKTFATLFPALVRKGFRAQYQLIGFEAWSPEEKWGYWATHVNHVRFGEDTRAVYQDLRVLTSGKDTFVMTSNVDAMFSRNGFDESKLFTPQGDYARLQCRTPCVRTTWRTRPVIDRILATLDPVTQTVTDPGAVPSCPSCGGPVFMNVRLDNAFLDEPYEEQTSRLSRWFAVNRDRRLLVVELGAGFNTPGVIRWPLERLVARSAGARMIRVNLAEPDVPKELGNRAMGLRMNAADAVRGLLLRDGERAARSWS